MATRTSPGDKPDEEKAQSEDLTCGKAKSSNGSGNRIASPSSRDSTLDPDSPSFNARHWMKSWIAKHDLERHPRRAGGFAFCDPNVYGFGADTNHQKTVWTVMSEVFSPLRKALGKSDAKPIHILRNLEGFVDSGEMLVVLGPPGSGCSTFLKTVAGMNDGAKVDKTTGLNYRGISAEEMHSRYRGETIYTAEVDVHFPHMTVKDTLDFAARARAPREVLDGLTTAQWADQMCRAYMAAFGIAHTADTRVGDDVVRGVSGGERKRVTIAEATLSGAPVQCWDNSTRGLDSSNAIEFCRTVRLSTELGGAAAAIALYQAPQAAYDTFNKALVLYQGRQIFFGRTTEVTPYFEALGFVKPERQTDADFATSMTSPQERVVRNGYESSAPRTPDDFATAWRNSPERAALVKDLEHYNATFPLHSEASQAFGESRKAQKSTHLRASSPFTLSYAGQVRLCLSRAFLRLKGDPSTTVGQLVGNTVMALILGSVFYQLDDDAASFFQRGAVIFFAVLISAFGSSLEVLTQYAQRPIVEKHARYAFYHPSAEAVASMLVDLPYKITNAIVFNVVLYFMVGLNQTPGAFFYFVFITFLTTLTMSMFFRTIASLSRTLSQALIPSALLILAAVIFTGFAIPIDYMLPWCRWINYLDPVAYAFEALMINEFAGRQFPCTQIVPAYGSIDAGTAVCSVVGAVPGREVVDGTAFIVSSYNYNPSHRWRNVGIIIAFTIGLMVIYLAASDLISAKKSKGEVLVFLRNRKPAVALQSSSDIEKALVENRTLREVAKSAVPDGSPPGPIFSWRGVCYDVKVKNQERRILDHVDGFVQPGTLTALMGVSGAGKTTLLDVLASRVSVGVISGKVLVDGQQRNSSFQRKTGYAQQQDLHLPTSTVREALNFSALLRQPDSTPRAERTAYVDEVVELLDMWDYVDAVVGVPGEGLNVEQRKRLTIGVELAAKPQLLLFLDEPTSGLDSQTSWAIMDLLERLKHSGQAILCTVHQPSAMLFQRFDRLLFLAKGGKTVYFGDIGENSNTLTTYFESGGAQKCLPETNPAEWMLEVIGAAPGAETSIDWPSLWRESKEYQSLQAHLDSLEATKCGNIDKSSALIPGQESLGEFATPFSTQMRELLVRIFTQLWRTPTYIYSKFALCFLASLFIGFVFYDAPATHQGLQNQMFSIFMLLTIQGQITQQIMPHFVTQRSLYEVREQPSKCYSWQAFVASNILVELPWNALMAVVIFLCFYFPVGMQHNAAQTDAIHERAGLFFLFVLGFLMFTSTFAHLVIAGIPNAEGGGALSNLCFMLCLIFCGVLATPEAMPGFWIFMYRVSPYTYLVSGLLSTGLGRAASHCADNEFLSFNAPSNTTCADYIQSFAQISGGYLRDPGAAQNCSFCSYSETDVFLDQISARYSERWRNLGILWVYVVLNVPLTFVIYWLARVPKASRTRAAT